MFDHHAGLVAADHVQTQGGRAVHKYGQLIWDMIVFVANDAGQFKTKDICHHIVCETGLAYKTAFCYFNAFIAYHREALETFEGPMSHIINEGRGRWKLIDSPTIN